jgi:hypothetical protein
MSGFKQAPSPPQAAEPGAEDLQRMYRASARALLHNRPLRGASAEAVQPNAALSKAELDALHAVGLSTEPWPADRPDDPLAQSIVDFVALVETSLTAARAARLLGVDVSRIRQRLRERSLFGVEYDGEWRLPRFQFERRKALPGLAQVLAALPADVNALDVAEWFLSPNPDLELEREPRALSPREWLLRGLPPERAAALAQGI